jgi:hypothetical protein
MSETTSNRDPVDEDVIGGEQDEEEKEQSKKTRVIDLLYDSVGLGIASGGDVEKAILKRNAEYPNDPKPLSVRNTANFLKDLIRKKTCNRNWPQRLKSEGITANQVYGKGQVIQFVQYEEGQTVPFPDPFEPALDQVVADIESLSLPRSARDLGRQDEPWLVQVIVYQRIIHHHFATKSPVPVVELSHLQMSVKTQPEIDAIFLATLEHDGNDFRVLVTCEAKQHNERILPDQIKEQVKPAFALSKLLTGARKVDAVIPVVVQVVDLPPDMSDSKRRGIFLVEFDMIDRSTFEQKYAKSPRSMPLNERARSLFNLRPSVQGITHRGKRPPSGKGKKAAPT